MSLPAGADAGSRRSSAGLPSDSNVLRKVASLTHTAAAQKASRPRYLPEKLDFKQYQKFEGSSPHGQVTNAVNSVLNILSVLYVEQFSLLFVLWCLPQR